MSKSVTSDAVRVTRTQVLKESFNFLLKTHVQVFLTASIIYTCRDEALDLPLPELQNQCLDPGRTVCCQSASPKPRGARPIVAYRT